MFDTHCHLSYLSPTADFPDCSSHSQSANLTLLSQPNHRFLCVAAQSSEWNAIISLAKSHNHVLPALGIHPWYVSQGYIEQLHLLEQLLSKERVYALGEIGLDLQARYLSNKALQIEAFEQQLALAGSHQLPVSLHLVKAHHIAPSILKSYQARGVIHGLGSSIEVVKTYIDLGFKFGVNAIACRSNAHRYHRMIDYFGLQHMVLETDFPNVALSGSNEAALADIEVVANFIAQRLAISIEEVIAFTDNNANLIFLNDRAS